MDGVDQHFELHPTMERKDAATVAAPTSRAIPMTMPSNLRNSSMPQANHLSYLVDHRAGAASFPPTYRNSKQRSKSSNSSKELGRRKQRRSENAMLLSTNPHAVRPSAKDYRLQTNTIKSTFPTHASASKANHQLLTNLPAPSHSRVGSSWPETDPVSSNHGHFGKSLKDARKVLKKLDVANISDTKTANQTAGDLERFVWTVDRQIRLWSMEEVHVLPDAQAKQQNRKRGLILLNSHFCPPENKGGNVDSGHVHLDSVQRKATDDGQLIEFQRTPNALVWLVGDPFLRLVVHCLARVYGCPSFSKDDLSRPGLRFTWILNKNPLARRQGGRRNRRASVSSSVMSSSEIASAAVTNISTAGNVDVRLLVNARLGGLRQNALETPPTTDFDSQTESEVDLAIAEAESELGTESDLAPDSLASSAVLVEPDDLHSSRDGVSSIDSEDGLADVERDGVLVGADEEDAATDEEEADILRRVRRWALDSHRQRARDVQHTARSTAPSHRLRNVTNAATAEDTPARTSDANIAIPEVSSEQEDDDFID